MQSFLSPLRFDELRDPGLLPPTLAALARTGRTHLSRAQAQYLPQLLRAGGGDAFVRAGTGSGKTLGFLLPVLETMGRAAGPAPPAGAPLALVLAPSRELAAQTHREAVALAAPGVTPLLLTGGGGSMQAEARLLRGGGGQRALLVATPGRLLAHLALPGLSLRSHLLVLVLDEADRMLDTGFLGALRRIVAALPPVRRTLLFTATVPSGVRQVASAFLSPDHAFLDCVADDPVRPPVDQACVVLPPRQVLPALVAALRAQAPQQVIPRTIVFFPTARMAEFAAALLRQCPPSRAQVLEIHSRLSQPQRTAAARRFREEGGVMCASDVIARGLDFPEVHLVVQVGHVSPEQYVHRVGRAGRAGRTGRALLILGDDEGESTLRHMRAAGVDAPVPAPPGSEATLAPELACPGVKRVQADAGLRDKAQKAYAASLGYYAGAMRPLGWGRADVLARVGARFAALGLASPQPLKEATLRKMGL